MKGLITIPELNTLHLMLKVALIKSVKLFDNLISTSLLLINYPFVNLATFGRDLKSLNYFL